MYGCMVFVVFEAIGYIYIYTYALEYYMYDQVLRAGPASALSYRFVWFVCAVFFFSWYFFFLLLSRPRLFWAIRVVRSPFPFLAIDFFVVIGFSTCMPRDFWRMLHALALSAFRGMSCAFGLLFFCRVFWSNRNGLRGAERRGQEGSLRPLRRRWRSAGEKRKWCLVFVAIQRRC